MNVSLKVLDTDKQIMSRIAPILGKMVNKALTKANITISERVQILIFKKIHQHETWQSVEEGSLRGHFGLAPSVATLKIVNTWAESLTTNVTFTQRQSKFKGKLTLHAIKTDYSDVVNMTEAITINKGKPLPWLTWLLTRGDDKIVKNFEIVFGPVGPEHESRSGIAYMVYSPGEAWNVPSEYAGTENNNFLTEVIREVVNGTELLKIIKDEINNAIK